MVAQVAAKLLAGRHRGPAARLIRSAAEGTNDSPAFEAYPRREHKLRNLESAEAADDSSRAVAVDTSFALGCYRLGVAADQAGRSSVARRAAARAVALVFLLTETDRALVRAHTAATLGVLEAAERWFPSIAEEYADDVEAWVRFRAVPVRTNPLMGRSTLDARHALEQAVDLDSDNATVLVV